MAPRTLLLRGTSAFFLLAALHTSHAQPLADSRAEFSGVQGQGDWFYGYRNHTADGGGNTYDPNAGFIPFAGGEGQGEWDGFSQFWSGTAWDLETAGAAPWTVLGQETVHPNGENSGEEHWIIRRWVANELTGPTPLSLRWNTRKQNIGGGSGVTGGVWVNGKPFSTAMIAFNNSTGVTRTNYLSATQGDRIDLVLTPVGTNGDRADGYDATQHWMVIEPAPDTDADGLPDPWERLFAPDLSQLTADGDADSDGLKDRVELALSTNPTKVDTDDDGLADRVETNTGLYVSASDTGTDPLRADTDGDQRKDGDEINGTPPTDPFNPDTDGDTFSDGLEVANGHNPNDVNDTLESSLIANSITEFSGIQGQDGWSHGTRNLTVDGGAQDYDPVAHFIPFPGGEGEGDWNGTTQVWTGSQWDMNTAGAAPWSELRAEIVHPDSNPVRWVIRRWEATELTTVTPLALRYHVRKGNLTCGNGVTAGLHINGKRADAVTLAFNDGTGTTRTVFANVAPTDRIDLFLSPRGTDGANADSCDGSNDYLHIDPVLPAVAYQPDGSVFIPVGAGDTDADTLPDLWEHTYFPNDLTKLTRTGDYDQDGLLDPEENKRGSDPTKPDTDGDGLSDKVETKTGVFVNASNTGTDPAKADSDADTLSDSAEVNGTPATDPNKADSDGDGYDDPSELATGHDPNDPNNNLSTTAVAMSVADFSGVQGQKGWYHGYRDLTATPEVVDYDPVADFIPFAGGQDQGEWDGITQFWTGTAWDLETAGAAPWTFFNSLDAHPNGPTPLHWPIRRWMASELTQETPLALRYTVRKSNPSCGNGVTVAVHLNGRQLDKVTIPFDNGAGVTRTYYAYIKPSDIVDLVLRPTGDHPEGGSLDNDWCDGSNFSIVMDTQIPAHAQQPDGTPFPPGGGGDIQLSMPVYSAGQFTLTWSSTTGAVYAVVGSTDLKVWTDIKTGIPSGGATTSYVDSPGSGVGVRFYQIRKQ